MQLVIPISTLILRPTREIYVATHRVEHAHSFPENFISIIRL